MKTTKTFCDVCGAEFKGGYWDLDPSGVVLSMSGPGANHGVKGIVFNLPEVCHPCRHGIIGVLRGYIDSRAQKP